MNNSDCLPRGDRQFLAWAVNFLKQLMMSIGGRVGFPPDVLMTLEQQRDDFALKLETAEEPSTRTKTAVQVKKDARSVLEEAIRHAAESSCQCRKRLQSGMERFRQLFSYLRRKRQAGYCVCAARNVLCR